MTTGKQHTLSKTTYSAEASEGPSIRNRGLMVLLVVHSLAMLDIQLVGHRILGAKLALKREG